MPYQKVATLNDLWDGEMLTCEMEGRNVLVVRHEDNVYAYEDRCPHQGFPLSHGQLAGNVLTCCAHHWQYNICNGQGINPAAACLKAFAVRVFNGSILVDTG